MSLRARGLSKTYAEGRGETVAALSGVDLEVPQGELLVVVGPSGSGKSTLLRCIAGLEAPSAGSIEVGGRDVTSLDPGERDVAMVFQDLALFPHMNVEENIAFGLRARHAPDAEVADAIGRAADMLGLDHLLRRRPAALSGGERQRVALARAVVRKPSVFLMDEPLSNLDVEMRTRMRAEIRALQRALDVTTVYVTHDQLEAMTLGDRIVLLREGEVVQSGTPVQLYDEPVNPFAARFFGSPGMNIFSAGVLGSGNGSIGIRPERLRLAEAGGRLRGTIELVEPAGPDALVHVRVGDLSFVVRTARQDAPSPGGSTGLDFSDSDLHTFSDPV